MDVIMRVETGRTGDIASLSSFEWLFALNSQIPHE